MGIYKIIPPNYIVNFMYQNRRSFLKTGLAGFGSVLLIPSCMTRASSWQFFTDEEAACVIALAEQVVPEDEHGGGATEAGVIHYIDRQLIAVFNYDQAIYQQGISALQSTCLGIHGKRFETLDFDTQHELCQQMWDRKLPGEYWEELDQNRFFDLVIKHTLQGFYGPPRHGGNKNYMSYKMMDLDFPLVISRNHYEHLS
jgi:gluconate 2-dehydrogenase gamma chain